MRFRPSVVKLPSSSVNDVESKKIVPKKGFKQDRFSKYFEGKGLTVNDLPKAIIFHELMGVFMLALTWSTCYFFPPSQNYYLKEPIAKMLSMVPKVLSGPVSSNPFLSSRIGTSYLESSCIRKLIRPITMPSKLYLTYRLVQALPKFENRLKKAPVDASESSVKVIAPAKTVGPSVVTMRGGYCTDSSNSWTEEYFFRSYDSHDGAEAEGGSSHSGVNQYCDVGDDFTAMKIDVNDVYNVMKPNYRLIG